MAKNDNGEMRTLGVLFGFLVLSVFLINTFIVYIKYSKKYGIDEADFRVHDSSMITNYLIQASLVALGLFFLALFAFSYIQQHYDTTIVSVASIIILLFIFTMLAISARAATIHIGMLVYKSRGIFVIPQDTHNNTLSENVFMLKSLRDLFVIEELPLSGVKKITRQSGTKLFIHGDFGTRCVNWQDKQKRDECISALEMSCGKRLSSVDMGM